MFAVIHIANFSLQAALRHERQVCDRPVALMDAVQSKPVITHVNIAARESKVIPGLTPSQAMARCGKLIIKTRSQAQEDAASDILLQTAYSFSPNIEATASGVCTIELKGLGLGTPSAAQAWAEKVCKGLALFHLDANIGVASTPDAALLAAHAADPILAAFDSDGFIPALPMEALDPPREILEILSGWGIRNVGEFLALGRNHVVERLGPAAAELFQRVSPDAIRPLKLVSPAEHFSEYKEFEQEIETVEPLLFMLRRFVEQLAQRLQIVYLTATGLHLQMNLASGAIYERAFKIPSPSRDIEILFRTLQTHLDKVRTDSPIVALQLSAQAGEPDSHQFGFFETTLRNPNQFAGTLACLNALCGPDRVGTPILKATHRPDAFEMEAPGFSSACASMPAESITGLQLRRFRPPVPATIELHGQQPVSIRSSAFSGSIVNVRGPFFSSGEWWDANRWARVEWDVETAKGALLRVFKSNEGVFVEGMYD
jgi:protein ImuB